MPRIVDGTEPGPPAVPFGTRKGEDRDDTTDAARTT